MSRSYLFVPADSERKLDRATTSGADALILDLEDSVAPAALPRARELAREFLGDSHEPEVWVRINPLDSPESVADLEAVVPHAPHGIVLPKPQGAGDAAALAARLDALETGCGLETGSIRILPVATERPAALFAMDAYRDCTPRLAGLTWGAEDLSAALGASGNRDADGRWLPVFELARSLCLLAAAAAGVAAVDTVFTDFRDLDGLAIQASAARRDGFEGQLAIHPAQVPVINEAFVPTADETGRAERIVDLFAANPDAGALALDGEMIDRPHLVQAQRILDNARRSGRTD